MKYLLITFFIGCFSFVNAQEQESEGHWDPNSNFTVMRLIVINDHNEMLLLLDDHVWAPPSVIFSDRQYLLEGLDSLSAAFGIITTPPKMHGYFGFKYDYHPQATMRAYFIAKHVSGDIKVPELYKTAEWVPINEALERISVTAIQEITKQLVYYPNIVWGGSFMVSHTEDDHPTKMVKGFYPLF